MEAWGVGRCAIGRWKVAAIAASMFSATIGGGLSPSGGIARAQEVAQKSFSIPPGPLSQALASFGKQAGLQVTYPSELTAGKQSSGVVGAATPQQALSKILGGSGLAYSFANAKTVVISGAAEKRRRDCRRRDPARHDRRVGGRCVRLRLPGYAGLGL
jgi:hypothetical protein